jgi:maltooligosyltrehalose trehalohydrolase
VPARRFVVYSQNHDQVGNRARSERLAGLVDFDSLKLAAAAVCLSPFLPLLFMGEEYGEEAPFQYFVSHSDPALIESVRKGRQEEFAAFEWTSEPLDPQGPETFQAARLRHHVRSEAQNAALFAFYRELLRLRREVPALTCLSMDDLDAVAFDEAGALYVRRWCEVDDVALVLHFGDEATELLLPLPPGSWTVALSSTDPAWSGVGPSQTTAAPETHRSDGQLGLRVPPRTAMLLRRERGN